MTGKLIGAFCVMVACGGYGFALAHRHLTLLRLLRQLRHILDRMQWALQYKLKTMPELCRMVSAEEKGMLSEVFLRLAVELDNQIQPDGRRCMLSVIESVPNIPHGIKRVLEDFGDELGRYDLHGQIEGINRVQETIVALVQELECNKGERVRGYKTLGLCAGTALIILFI